jgi:hypothetical protein
VGAPVHEPADASSVWFSCATPLIVGGSMLTGASGTTLSVGADTASAVTDCRVANTRTRSVWPTSGSPNVYVLPVAPSIELQFAPSASQRSHW